jgi:SAM-dependent methyltransferase
MTFVSSSQIRFNDGAAYERYMGAWSQRVGEAFLDWLALRPGLRWLDVGCGNGAFTEILAGRSDPQSVYGVDPSEEQIRYARERPVASIAQFSQGDAMALPFDEGRFDVAVMPLVIFFVPEPIRGVAEMARVVRAGGTVAAYGWDLLGGGFPYAALQEEMRGMGLDVPIPPNPGAAQIQSLRDLWSEAGLCDIETQEIAVERTFADFDEYWTIVLGAPSVGPTLRAMSPERAEALKARLRERLGVDVRAPIVCGARANAVKGRVAPE